MERFECEKRKVKCRPRLPGSRSCDLIFSPGQPQLLELEGSGEGVGCFRLAPPDVQEISGKGASYP